VSYPSKPFHRYALAVEIPATEVAILADALDGERFSLGDRLGSEELAKQLEEQLLHVELQSEAAWPEFQKDIETLSVYLSEPISGREFHVEPGGETPRLEGWLILGNRGETERIALDLAWNPESGELVDRGIDERQLQGQLPSLPDWARNMLTRRATLEGGLRDGRTVERHGSL
jgi:hypothetical protein